LEAVVTGSTALTPRDSCFHPVPGDIIRIVKTGRHTRDAIIETVEQSRHETRDAREGLAFFGVLHEVPDRRG
jgi:hypothetical protein